MKKILNYLTYSGASISIMLNPWHWSWIPSFKKDDNQDVWELNTHKFKFLFLTVRFWIDDGSW